MRAESERVRVDEERADGRKVVDGSSVSLADVQRVGMLALSANGGQPINAEHKHVCEWFGRMGGRPSAAA